MPCKLPEHVADEPFGLESRYSLGLRRLAVFAAADESYRKGSEALEEFCGLELSYNTVRKLCNEEAPKMEEWCKKSAEVQKEFIDAPGNIEVTMDGTCVNTTGGACEVRVGSASKRKRGHGVLPEKWGSRNRQELPEIETSIAFAAVEDCGEFKKRWHYWRSRLQLGATSDISALGDGAPWIWNIIKEVFGGVRECLDVYHGLEHVSDTGKVLYGEGTEEYKQWQEETTMEFVASGFNEIEKRLNLLEQGKLESKAKESLRLLRGYLENNRERLCYRERLAEGRAIGSGQIEGACKNLIGKRLKQTWAKWKLERVNRMATIRAIRYSNLWKNYWKQEK
jgi:hypothetical protein